VPHGRLGGVVHDRHRPAPRFLPIALLNGYTYELIPAPAVSGTANLPPGAPQTTPTEDMILEVLRDAEAPMKIATIAHKAGHKLANFLRQLVLPKPIKSWTLTTLREKLIKIGAKVVRHSKYVLFQLADVAVPRKLFARILGRIARLCPACASG
jgi:hypothetical protein